MRGDELEILNTKESFEEFAGKGICPGVSASREASVRSEEAPCPVVVGMQKSQQP